MLCFLHQQPPQSIMGRELEFSWLLCKWCSRQKEAEWLLHSCILSSCPGLAMTACFCRLRSWFAGSVNHCSSINFNRGSFSFFPICSYESLYPFPSVSALSLQEAGVGSLLCWNCELKWGEHARTFEIIPFTHTNCSNYILDGMQLMRCMHS